MDKHCCQRMSDAINHKFAEHDNPFDCPDNLIYYSAKLKEYGLIIHDGGKIVVGDIEKPGNYRVAQADPYVLNIVEKVTAHKLQTRVLDEAAMGNIVGATPKLVAAATRLLEMGEQDPAQAAMQEADTWRNKVRCRLAAPANCATKRAN